MDQSTAFRPLLFLDNAQLTLPTSTNDVPTLILLHHILSRSVLPLPHQTHGWTEAEYVRWLNEHGEADRLMLVERALSAWELEGGRDTVGEKERKEGDASVEVLRTVMQLRK